MPEPESVPIEPMDLVEVPRHHFLDLVQQGRRLGSSTTEQRARRIALSLGENLPGLDAAAVEGLHEFIDRLVAKPGATRDMIR